LLNILCVDLTAGSPEEFIPNDSPEEIKPYDILNISLIVIANIYGITLLAVHWRMGVRDNFRFTTELRLQGFTLLATALFFYLLMRTHFLDDDDSNTLSYILNATSALSQLLITDCCLYRACAQGSRKKEYHSTTLENALRDERMFIHFSSYLKREFGLEKLNFLVAVILYERSLNRECNFGFETSSSETEDWKYRDSSLDGRKGSLIFWRLHWLHTSQRKNTHETALHIYREYCAPTAPQKLDLSESIRETLVKAFSTLSYKSCWPQNSNIFKNAFVYIYNDLENGAFPRFTMQASGLCDCWRRKNNSELPDADLEHYRMLN